MELIVIQSTKHLSVYKEEWDSILRDEDNKHPVLEYPFFSSWWDTIGRAQEIEVYAVKEFTRVVAFFPFQVDRSSTFTNFRFIEDPRLLYKGFIIRKKDIDRVFMYFFDELIKREKKCLFQLDGFIDQEQVASLSLYLQARNIKMEKTSKHITDIPFSAFSYLTYIPLKEKMYLESIGDIEIVNGSLDSIKSFLPAEEYQFYEKIGEVSSEIFQLHLWTLLHHKEAIANYLGFTCRGKFAGYRSFYRDEYKLFNLERVLLSECLKNITSEAKYSLVEDINLPYVVSNYQQTSIETVQFSSKRVFSWFHSSNKNSNPLEETMPASSSKKLLLARLSSNKLRAPKSYKKLTKEDFSNLKSSKRYTLQKIAEGFEGFYSKQPEWCFWVHPTHIVSESIRKNLDEQSIYLIDWENEDLEKVLSFVQDYYRAKHIYVSVEKKDKENKKKLKFFGFEFLA